MCERRIKLSDARGQGLQVKFSNNSVSHRKQYKKAKSVNNVNFKQMNQPACVAVVTAF